MDNTQFIITNNEIGLSMLAVSSGTSANVPIGDDFINDFMNLDCDFINEYLLTNSNTIGCTLPHLIHDTVNYFIH